MTVWDRLSHFAVGLLVVATLAGVLLWSFFWYLPLFQTNNQLRKQIYSLDVKIQEQERLARQLRAAIEAGQNDPRTVERLARERLGMARTNETVFRFEAPKTR